MAGKGAVNVQAVKSCEDSLNAFFVCLNKEGTKGDFNACRAAYNTLTTCSDTVTTENAKETAEGDKPADKSLSGVLQAALPRVFKNVEDLPRERTILSDTLAKVAPHVFLILRMMMIKMVRIVNIECTSKYVQHSVQVWKGINLVK